MLFSPNRSARRARASVHLPGVLICVILATVGASMPANRCPDHIDCAIQKRHFCVQGTSHCGPCLSPLEEDETGQCVQIQRPHNHLTNRPDVDEEIDFLSAVMAQQQKAVSSPSDSRSPPQSHAESKPKSLNKAIIVEPTTSGPSTPTHQKPKTRQPNTTASDRHGPSVYPHPSRDGLLVLMISLCIIVGAMALIVVTVCWVRLQRETHLAQKVDYPAFQPPGPNQNHSASGDKTLAHSAQMYHYQHQKQQMLSMEKHKAEPKASDSGAVSDEENEENEEGDFTVYECPGLAPTGEMEVKNPLFDDSTLQSQKNHK